MISQNSARWPRHTSDNTVHTERDVGRLAIERGVIDTANCGRRAFVYCITICSGMQLFVYKMLGGGGGQQSAIGDQRPAES